MIFNIAIVQFEPKGNSYKENLKSAEYFIKRASEKKANIIVFPENFLSRAIRHKRDFIDTKMISKEYFKNLAKKYHIDIVTGSILEKNFFGFIYNTAYYIDCKGNVRSKYRKINLWDIEKKYIESGKKASVFKTKYGKIGLIICWDLIFSDNFKKMVKKGVEVVICPAHWCSGDAKLGLKYDRESEIKLVDSLCVERAFENEIILVFCNTAGKLRLKNSWDISIGHSQVTEPFRGCIKKLNHNREAMFIQKINTDILKDAESSYRIRKDLQK